MTKVLRPKSMAELMASVSDTRSTNIAWSAADAVSGRRDRPARPDRRGDIRSKDTDRSYTSNSSICQHCQYPGGSGSQTSERITPLLSDHDNDVDLAIPEWEPRRPPLQWWPGFVSWRIIGTLGLIALAVVLSLLWKSRFCWQAPWVCERNPESVLRKLRSGTRVSDNRYYVKLAPGRSPR